MPNIGPLELAIIAVILLLLFGAKRIPEIGRSFGTGARELRESLAVSDWNPSSKGASENATKEGPDPG